MSLGIDVGIDRNGELYVFEVNDGPATSAVISEVAYLRSNYYMYILKHKLDSFTNESKVSSEKHKDLIANRNFYKKEYDKLKSSTSWKVTAPLRKLGSIKKKIKNKR